MEKVKKQIHVNEVHHQGIYGAGVTIAVLDSGVWIHPDLENKIIAFYDTISGKRCPYDDNEHGTHVSSIIGGTGKLSNGIYGGIAPKSKIVSIKVLDYKGNGNTKNVVNGIDWLVNNKEKYGIKIANISVGTVPKAGSQEKTILIEAVERAWSTGLVVVVAAGNNGPKPMTITTPGISKKVITVGSYDQGQVNYSGRGPTPFCIKKPDIVAPGNDILACKVMRNTRYRNLYDGYIGKSGTSMATPIVSGCIALLLEKYPHMTNVEVKLKLREAAVDLHLPQNEQGWGLIDAVRLLK